MSGWRRNELGGYYCPKCEHTIYCCSLRDEPFELPHYCPKCGENMKEQRDMKVSYNGFTGELVKLERSYAGKFELPISLTGAADVKWLYDLSIYDSEKKVTHSFTGVKLEEVKFLGGAVSFDA